MQITRARTAGFCMGVSMALRQLDAALQKHTEELITLGPIIHNPRVITDYAAKGVRCVHNIQDIHPNQLVLIRAHGIPVEEQNLLLSMNCTIIDATCPKVKKAQEAIQEQYQKNKGTLLLFGETEHPEVRGLVSYAANQALVLDSLEMLQALPLEKNAPYYLAAQTTQNQEVFTQMAQWIRKQYPHVPILHTICAATRNRQEETIKIAQTVEMFVVIGGQNSGNTRRLAKVAAAQGIPVVHIEDVEELHTPAMHKLLHGKKHLGLTAGASTPKEHIDIVETYLRKNIQY